MATSVSDAASSPAVSDISSRARMSWVLFEVGRNPSFVLIATFIYAPYFQNTLVGNPVVGQALWADIQVYSGLLVAASAPFLAAIAEAGGPRKPWIAFFAAILALSCAALWYGMPGGEGLPLLAIAAAIAIYSFAYDSTMVFHSAMLSSLIDSARVGRLSGLGYGLGNVASFTVLVFFLALIALPLEPAFGLDRAMHEDARIVGPIAAAWFFVLALPFFLWTPDRPRTGRSLAQSLHQGLASLTRTVKSLKHYANVAKYLLARTIYNDGLTTMLFFGGVYASGIFGWQIQETGLYGIIVIPFAAIGGYYGGRLADRIGTKRALQLSLAGTILAGFLSLGFTPERLFFVIPYTPGTAVLPLPYFETAPELFYLLVVSAAAVCVVASYANSRAMMARLAPEARMTEFFGLYTMSGEATAWLGPAAVAIATRVSDSQQWGMAAILILLITGFVGMAFVKEERATVA
jgi:UMF1 family MFS transporter